MVLASTPLTSAHSCLAVPPPPPTPSPHTVPSELLLSASKTLPLPLHTPVRPSSFLSSDGLHPGPCPSVRPAGSRPRSERPRAPTYPQPDNHHHHKVDDDDRDIGRIAEALVGCHWRGDRSRGRGAPGATVHGGGNEASLRLALYAVSGLMISPGAGHQRSMRSLFGGAGLLR